MKNIIVVTGTSSGMGKEFVNQIKKDNIDEIWAIARNESNFTDLGVKIVSIKLDLSKEEDLKKYKEMLDKSKPNIKILGNFAGFGKFEHSENIPLDVKLNMVDLNIKGYISMIDYSLPYMKENSNIINVVSDSAFQPIPYINCYASTKAFLLSYSRALNMELKYRKIHVLAVCPFWTKTKFFDRAIMNKSNKEVVIYYAAKYNSANVVKKLIKDMNSNKDMSVYGFVNNMQWILAKILPHKLVMKIWMHQQKYDGTPNIR